MNCRFCNNVLTHEFVDLGSCPPSNSFLKKEDLGKPEAYYPLKLFVCEKCFLVQIAEYKKANDIFNNEYVYFSSFSKSWLEHAHKYTEMMTERFHLGQDSQVIEIASNDGYLLQYFKEKNIPVLGIEPTSNTAAEAKRRGIETVVDFFGVKLAKELSGQNRKADLLLGNNVLAHVPDINDFVSGMKIILKRNGVITMEFPHLLQMVENNQFDTIYHEHFSYLSLLTVKGIFETHGLFLFDVEEVPTHGGSLRIYAKHAEDKQEVSSNVNALIEREKRMGLDSINYYKDFDGKAKKIKNELLRFLSEQKQLGKKVAAYGAAAKGNTLLNYCGVKSDLISFVVDASPHKQGKYLPGNHIQVVNEDKIKEEKPDFILILPWNIAEEIVTQLSYIDNWGAKFVKAIPDFKIY
jgi:2-polyprenyl-3-methyl-5-hydroxy-6-metoxy-1,4-benzoquinol methylase